MSETGKDVCTKTKEAAKCIQELASKDNIASMRKHVESLEKITKGGSQVSSLLKAVDLFAKFGKAMPYVGAIVTALMLLNPFETEEKPELKLLQKVTEQNTKLQKSVRLQSDLV